MTTALPELFARLRELDAERQEVIDAIEAEMLRLTGERSAPSMLTFDDDTRTVTWPGGGRSFSRQAIRRYRLVPLLFVAENKMLSGHELGFELWGDERTPWDRKRSFALATEFK